MISKALINSYINYDNIVSVNNLLKEYNEMKESIKNPKKSCGIHYIKATETYGLTCKENTTNKNSNDTQVSLS